MRTIADSYRPQSPLVAVSWDITSEHEKLAPFAADLAAHAQAFMVGPYAYDRESVTEALRFCDKHGLVPLLHTLDLDLCGLDPIDEDLVKELGKVARLLEVEWATTDLAMWARNGEFLVEAMVAMPWVADAADYIAPRVERIQELLGVRVAVENSAYAYVVGSENPYSIQTEIARRADSYLVFDIGHHLIATAVSGEDPMDFLPTDFGWDRVVECHISGVTVLDAAGGGVTADDQHAAPISEELWDLGRVTMPNAAALRTAVAESEGIRGVDLVEKTARLAKEVAIWQSSWRR